MVFGRILGRLFKDFKSFTEPNRVFKIVAFPEGLYPVCSIQYGFTHVIRNAPYMSKWFSKFQLRWIERSERATAGSEASGAI